MSTRLEANSWMSFPCCCDPVWTYCWVYADLGKESDAILPLPLSIPLQHPSAIMIYIPLLDSTGQSDFPIPQGDWQANKAGLFIQLAGATNKLARCLEWPKNGRYFGVFSWSTFCVPINVKLDYLTISTTTSTPFPSPICLPASPFAEGAKEAANLKWEEASNTTWTRWTHPPPPPRPENTSVKETRFTQSPHRMHIQLHRAHTARSWCLTWTEQWRQAARTD